MARCFDAPKRGLNIIGLICLLCLNGFAAKAETVKFATFDYPPLFHTSKSERPSGTVVETVTYMCEQAGLNCQIEILPFKRAYQKLENKLVDGLITIKVDQFEECCTSVDWETPWSAGFFSHTTIQNTPKHPNEVLGERLIVVAGMRSPYEFMPDLDQWHQEEKIKIFQANNVFIATRMFLNKRANFLWGSEDFYWYFNKQETRQTFNFLPLIIRPVTVWIRKEKDQLRQKLNRIFHDVDTQAVLNPRQLLKEDLMRQRYEDAPFKYK